jgi:hypothetical protein
VHRHKAKELTSSKQRTNWYLVKRKNAILVSWQFWAVTMDKSNARLCVHDRACWIDTVSLKHFLFRHYIIRLHMCSMDSLLPH